MYNVLGCQPLSQKNPKWNCHDQKPSLLLNQKYLSSKVTSAFEILSKNKPFEIVLGIIPQNQTWSSAAKIPSFLHSSREGTVQFPY